MSVLDSGREATGDDEQSDNQPELAPYESDLYDLEYEETLAQSRDNQKDVVRDWARGIYPSNEQSSRDDGVIYCSSLEARQYADAGQTGIVRHGRAIEAVRTVTGRIFRNTGCTHNSTRGMNGSCRAGSIRHIKRQPKVPDEIGDAVTSTDLRFLVDILTETTNTRRWQRMRDGRRLRDIVAYDQSGSGELFTFQDELQIFIGRDSTAHGSGQYGFRIPDDTIVESADEAVELLKPQLARHAERNDIEFDRQGEWFFVDADELIDDFDGTIQKPGLGAKPYGPSPMDNHVPRDWKAFVADDVFVERFNDHVKYIDGQVVPQTVEECLERFHTNDYHYETDIDADNLYEFAEYVAVRGSVRHRGNDHFQESFDDWRIAVAHDVDVYTSDDFGVRID